MYAICQPLQSCIHLLHQTKLLVSFTLQHMIHDKYMKIAKINFEIFSVNIKYKQAYKAYRSQLNTIA